ncbi:hypothetical protein Agub_g9316 [Astrephomene gubernaculifera]|uniref:Uncharacterized protein n=1 Tax=Astrephomene gubernaculifera TaxID=47775 RepID=A0AAD3HN61_9CHLO|nr:hypothetical protein Agub_g9316 [Astrephomene gubernaculifera]
MRLCCALALLLLPAALAGNAGSLSISSPLLLWSNRGVLGQGKHVTYQVFPEVEKMASELVLGALGKSAGSEALSSLSGQALNAEEPRTIVMFIGRQLDVADMRGRSEAVHGLNSLLEGAVSSLAVPYATSKGASIRENVCSKLDEAGISHEVVGCAAPSTDLAADVAAALAKGDNTRSRVVVVCSGVESAQGNTNAGLAAEVEQLKAVQTAVEAAGANHVFVYASQATPEPVTLASAGAKRRSLQQAVTYTGFGPYQECGPLCKTQVRWLEGMLAALFLALASCAGLVCLYVLDTPTRFEAPKEGGPQ